MCDVQNASLDELPAPLWSSRHSDWIDTFTVNVTTHHFLSVALLKLLAAASHLDLPGGLKGRDQGKGGRAHHKQLCEYAQLYKCRSDRLCRF
jgi:hypothetical protein